MSTLLLVAMCLQEPKALLDDLSRLVDGAGIGAKLPDEFWRAALAGELKAREKMGERFPRAQRVSLDARARPADAVFSDLSEKLPLRTEYALDRSQPLPWLTLKLEDVPAVEALWAVCCEAKARPFFTEDRPINVIAGPGLGVEPVRYRNFLVRVETAGLMRRVEFGGATCWMPCVLLSAVWDARARALEARVEFADALDDGGRALAAAGWGTEDAPDDVHVRVGNGTALLSALPLVMKAPDGEVSKVARLRGWLVVRTPLATSAFAFVAGDAAGTTRADEHLTATLVERIGNERRVGIVRLKPKAPVAEFAKLPLQFAARLKDGREVPLLHSAKPGEKEVACELALSGEIESLVVEIHRETLERRIPFDFRDVPLR